MRDSGLDIPSSNERIGLIVGTSVGNLNTAFAFKDKLTAEGQLPPHTAFYCFSHSIASIASAELDLRGPTFTISQGCSSGQDMFLAGTALIKSSQCDSVLLIGVDNELSAEIFAALEGSNSLSTSFNDRPKMALRPFDKKRDGNVLGEGACAVVIEDGRAAEARKARSYARVISSRCAGVGGGRQYNAATPEPETATLKRILSESFTSITNEDSSPRLAICANGSGSVLYDPIEATTLNSVFAIAKPHVYSIKGEIGQHGAPSAALQIVASANALNEGLIPGTINCDEPIDELGSLNVEPVTKSASFDYVICNSIGLGGFFYSSICLGRSGIKNKTPPETVWGNMRLSLV